MTAAIAIHIVVCVIPVAITGGGRYGQKPSPLPNTANEPVQLFPVVFLLSHLQ
jgi:hypothetical protein